MSLDGLRKFNAGYGFPLHRKPGVTKRSELIGSTILAIPFAALILTKCNPKPKLDPASLSRTILASTIVGLPIIFALDIIATLFTQPIGRALEKRHIQQRQAAQE